MEGSLIIVGIIICVLQIADNNRILNNLKKHFNDEYVPQDYSPSNAGLIFLLVIFIFAAVIYLIGLFQ